MMSPAIPWLDLTGFVFPVIGQKPLLISQRKIPDLFLPVFSTESQLKATMEAIGIEYLGVHRIVDGARFLDNLPLRLTSEGLVGDTADINLRVIVDPSLH